MESDIEDMLARINALEISASGEYQRGMVHVLRGIVQNQAHAAREMDHLKKAIDLVTGYVFELRNKSD